MITQNIYSTDIYENRVIVGFLRTIINSISLLIKKINDLLVKLPFYEEIPASDYVYSPSIIFSGTKKMLEDGVQKLNTIHGKLEQLFRMYKKAMHTNYEPVDHMYD